MRLATVARQVVEEMRQEWRLRPALRKIRGPNSRANYGVCAHSSNSTARGRTITPCDGTRGNDRYRIVYVLSCALLRRRGAETATASGEAVLLDSAESWELFLFRRLQTIIRSERRDLRIEGPRERRAAPPRMLLEWNDIRTRMLIPDIIITERDSYVNSAILDAKYRTFRLPNRGPRHRRSDGAVHHDRRSRGAAARSD